MQVDMRPVSRTRRQVFGYLVVFQTGGGQAALEQAQQTLRDKGVADFYPLTADDYRGAISLGAFPGENQALAMQREMRAKGVQAVVKPRTKNRVEQYALVGFADADDARWRALMQKYPGIALKALPADDPFCAQNQTHETAETKSPASAESLPR